MKAQLEQIRANALEKLQALNAEQELEELRVRVLGKKGELTGILKQLGSLSKEERPVVGQLANEVRAAVEAAIEEKRAALKAAAQELRLQKETIDVTMPGQLQEIGKIHPLTRVLEEVKEIFFGMGFSTVEGPEVEYDYYNF